MSITVLTDVILPHSVLAAGIKGRSVRNNTRVESLSGHQTINVNWSKTLRQYEVGIAPMAIAQWQALEGLYEVTEGGAYGFLMLDPKDSFVAVAEGYLQASGATIGYGYGVPSYQLFKRYAVLGSARAKDRSITRPKATPTVKRGGVTVTHGAAAGNIALDYDTGTVAFVADTSQAHTSITVGASTVLNYADGAGIVAALAVGERVYVAGVTGTAAAALNGLSHVVTAKGATSLTVSTSTAGLAVTGAGTAYKYPQASDTLTWTGRFYVPVHFQNDDIDWTMVVPGPSESSRFLTGPSVLLQEIRE